MSSYEVIINPEGWECGVEISAEYSPAENGMCDGWEIIFAQAILSDDVKISIDPGLLPKSVIEQLEQEIGEKRSADEADRGDYEYECWRDSRGEI